ncbi:hypothetical protein HETIRDRAFT_165388 [Heterobasidion irregulare TC 32-1]|uniref:C2H2-type domain-containing protein n=1 Tax=Heterobasidion irregulare (strain TC 32-1) TaxID=747525 RepID=W4KB60_HETIT|nr:uncharacterized protein HETIRDRAFT_165388 [Heterobasidion irregulare TC 32-1]ETW82605.1 hypothetical protein HETIRDRAFT_165388 [Heterobasidion irregulare TC 32-1]
MSLSLQKTVIKVNRPGYKLHKQHYAERITWAPVGSVSYPPGHTASSSYQASPPLGDQRSQHGYHEKPAPQQLPSASSSPLLQTHEASRSDLISQFSASRPDTHKMQATANFSSDENISVDDEDYALSHTTYASGASADEDIYIDGFQPEVSQAAGGGPSPSYLTASGSQSQVQKTSEDTIWCCKKCQSMFGSKADMELHEATAKGHKSKRAFRDSCGNALSRGNSLKRHKENRHDIDEELVRDETGQETERGSGRGRGRGSGRGQARGRGKRSVSGRGQGRARGRGRGNEL